MARGSYFSVYFRGAASLDDAARALPKSMEIQRDGECLVVRWGSGPELVIGLSAEEHVPIEAAEVAEDHGLPELVDCDRRFEVSFDDLEAVLDETNTLAEVQMTLQAMTRGFLHNAWNGIVTPPEG